MNYLISTILLPPYPPHRLLTTSPPGHATSEDISPAHSWPKFEEFLSAYPFDQTMAVDRAKGEFERLSIEERLKAVRCAKLYRSALEKRGPSVCALNATTWPERRKWLEAELVETLASCARRNRIICRERVGAPSRQRHPACRRPSNHRWRADRRLARQRGEFPMSAAARRTARRKATPPSESSVYAGRELLGVISPRKGGFAARLASGQSLGNRYPNERDAMKAITSAARDACGFPANSGDSPA
jgi:hypothetical protein